MTACIHPAVYQSGCEGDFLGTLSPLALPEHRLNPAAYLSIVADRDPL